MVTRPPDFEDEEEGGCPPLSQLLLNSHSPVVLSALIDKDLHPVEGSILFADTATVSDPESRELRRKTRLRPVKGGQLSLFGESDADKNFVSEYEVKKVLETVGTED